MLKTTFRYLISHKIFSVINLSGMAIGLTVCYFAMRYVAFELSYDSFNTKANRIYRVVTDVKTPTGVSYESAAAPLAPALQAAFPEIKSSVRILLDNLIIQKDDKTYSDELIAYADSSLFSVFTFPLLSGNPKTVFDAPFTMVISETAAKRYFGTTDCLGKTLLVDGKNPATITGVMKDIPQNSHFRVEMILSMSTLLETFNPARKENWSLFGMYTYVLLPKGFHPEALQAKLPAFIKKQTDGKNGEQYSLFLEPLKSLYLHAKARGWRTGSTESGNLNNVYTVSVIAVFVLFIACFNFINLSTAFSLYRNREIGVRKVLGATKKQLILQFLTDAVLLSIIAFALTFILCILLLPLFNRLCNKVISPGIVDDPLWLAILFVVSLFTGLLSGIYPAFFLSSFKTTKSLKGSFVSVDKGISLRKVLVIAQFSVSIMLIVATIVVYQQLHFMQNQDLGFDKEHKLVIDFHYDNRIIANRESVKNQLMNVPGIKSVSMASCIPGKNNRQFTTTIENGNGDLQEAHSDAYFIDYNYLKQYGIKMKAGRPFSKNRASDSLQAMLVNETAVKSLGYKNDEDILGKRFKQGRKEGYVIGVIDDFHFRSYQEKISPLTLTVSPWFYTFLTVDVSGENMQETIGRIEKTWAKLAAGLPMVYFFADETYDAQYKAEARFGRLFICFATLAILISCLGLLGLSAFATTQRTKEIGIRKVLGASVASVVHLLTQDFLKLILLSFFIAVPVAWLAMNHWLQNFAYRINISWWMFALAGSAAVIVALFTISFHAIKSALANPVRSLRSE